MKRRLSGFVLCFFLLLQGVCSSLAEADGQTPKTKSCHIHAVVRWNIGDNGKQIEGSLNLVANGTLRLSDTLRQPVTKMQGNLVYEVGHIDLIYAFQETTRDKKTMFCKENPILEEWSASGSYLFGGGEPSGAGLYIRNMGMISPPASMVKGAGAEQFLAMLQAQMPQVVPNYYEFFGFGSPPPGVREGIVINGRVRKNDCTFREVSKKLSPAISIRFKIPENGKLEGAQSWNAKYEGGMSMFKIGISDLPETMEKEPFKPSQFADGNISYDLKWSFEELKPEIRIYQYAGNSPEKQKDITNNEQDSIVGEKINLVARALGLIDYRIENPVWKIGGKIINNYEAGEDFARLDSEVNLEGEEVSFAWVRGDFSGKPEEIEVTGSIGGKEVSGKTTFKVFAPKVARRDIRCSSRVTLGYRYDNVPDSAVEALQAGNISCRDFDADPESLAGDLNKRCSVYPGRIDSFCDSGQIEKAIVARYTVEIPWKPENGYALQYVQVGMENSVFTTADHVEKEKSNDEWCLDTEYPYAGIRLFHPGSCQGLSCVISMEDTPEQPLEGKYTGTALQRASLKHSFKIYLMFRPSAEDSDETTLWVPLEKVTWRWSATAERLLDGYTIPCGDAYRISGQEAPAESGCNHTTVSEFPEWNCNLTDND